MATRKTTLDKDPRESTGLINSASVDKRRFPNNSSIKNKVYSPPYMAYVDDGFTESNAVISSHGEQAMKTTHPYSMDFSQMQVSKLLDGFRKNTYQIVV